MKNAIDIIGIYLIEGGRHLYYQTLFLYNGHL